MKDSALPSESRVGHFLFFDGRIVGYTQFEQEKGIFIDEKRYIPLSFINSGMLNKVELKEYCAKHGIRVPYLCELMPLVKEKSGGSKTQNLVNRAFEKYQRTDCKVPDDILGGCWYQEILDDVNEIELRRFVPVNAYQDIATGTSMIVDDGNCIIMPDGGVWVCKDGRYIQAEMLLKASWGMIKLLLVSEKYLFCLRQNCLTFVGADTECFGADIISCSSGIYQICSDELRLLTNNNGCLQIDDHGQLVISHYDNSYFGGGQPLCGVFKSYYQLKDGRWVSVGCTTEW